MRHTHPSVVVLCAMLFAVAVAVAVAAACGGSGKGDSPTSNAGSGDKTTTASSSPAPAADPGMTVKSDDGKLSLFIPDGAIPAGTNVSITALPHDQLPVELRQVVGSGGGYRLEPDRLVFGMPATATLTIDRSELDDEAGAPAAYALVSFNQTAGREVLDSETHASSDGSTVTVSAQLSHFSWITRTKGSLKVELLPVPHEQAVGAMFRPVVTVRVVNEQVTLAPVDGTMLIGGALEFAPAAEKTFHNDSRSKGSGQDYFYPVYKCLMPGIGSYGVRVTAVSHVESTPNLSTQLAVTLDATVECREGTVEPQGIPSPQVAPPPREVHLVQTLGCEHTQPGVRSELRKKGRITDRSGGPLKGVEIFETATGPGLENADGPASEVQGYDVTDANGEFTFIWTITQFGPYGVKVTDVTLADGSEASLDETSTTSLSYTVGAVCTPP